MLREHASHAHAGLGRGHADRGVIAARLGVDEVHASRSELIHDLQVQDPGKASASEVDVRRDLGDLRHRHGGAVVELDLGELGHGDRDDLALVAANDDDEVAGAHAADELGVVEVDEVRGEGVGVDVAQPLDVDHGEPVLGGR